MLLTSERNRIDIDGVRAGNPLPAVVGASLKLHRAGSEWKACCPFHADRSPSFTIFDGGGRPAPGAQARKKSGGSCRSAAMRGKRVCFVHGGASNGAPKGPEDGA